MLGFFTSWIGWVVLGVVIVVIAVVCWLTLRSATRWKSPPPKTPEAMDAEARLWSKYNVG